MGAKAPTTPPEGPKPAASPAPPPRSLNPDEPIAITRGEFQALLESNAQNTAVQLAAHFREAMQQRENQLIAQHLDQVRDLRLSIRSLRRQLGKPPGGKA